MDTIPEEKLLSDTMDVIPEEVQLGDPTDVIPGEVQLGDPTDVIPGEIQLNDDIVEEVPERRGFTIKAISLENMEPLKKIMVKVELNGKSAGQSELIFVQDKEVEVNWETFFEISEVTEGLLDELITHPLVFTVLCESVPPLEEPLEPKKGNKGKKEKTKGSKSPSEKDKSVKEHSVSNESKKTTKSTSKSVSSNNEAFPVLGVANLDILPLLLGQDRVEEVLFLNPTTEQKGSETIAWANLPKLNVSISTGGNVSDDVSGTVSNIIFFTLESLHNISPDCNEDVEVATILPTNQIIKFKKGTLLLDDSVWVSKRKKWFGLRDLPGQGALSPYKFILHDFTLDGKRGVRLFISNINSGVGGLVRILDNISDLFNTMDYDIANNSLPDKPRIHWNQLHRSFLNADSEDILKEKMLGYNCWPVEILIPSSSGKSEGRKKVEKLNDGKINHYVTFLDLSKLIYPGEKAIRLTSQLYTYTEDTMKMRFGSLPVLFDEIATSPDVQETKPKTASSKKEAKAESSKSKKGSLKSKDGKKQKIDKVEEVKEEEPEVPKEPEAVFNDNGEPIFIIVEVELLKPLVESREEEKVLESIHRIIPKREPLTPKQMETINATKLYEECIKNLIHNIHDEYQIFSNVNETFKNSCKNFLMHLHVTGAYAKMAESMRGAVTAHVRDAVGPADTWGKMQYECQDLLTSLYQEMAGKMYAIVNSFPDPSMEKYEPEVTCDHLQYFESEALEEGDYAKAHYYLLQRLEKTEKASPQVWVDFAGYWKQKLEFEKAEECAKEAISLDPRHTHSLLFHGLLSWLTEDFDVAEMFLLALVTFNPTCLEGWVTLHMLHKQMGKQKEASVELLNAKDCISEYTPFTEEKSNLYWCAGMGEVDRIFLLTAVKLLSLSFPEFAELALSYDLLLHGRTISYLYYLAVCHYQQGRYTNSIAHLEEALKMHWEDDRLWALKGHNFYKLQQLEEAKQAYKVALNFQDQEDEHLINLRLGNILMSEGDHEAARNHYMIICKDSPTPLSWLGLGISAFAGDDMEGAELALSEANTLDCKMGRVWGYIALVNLMLDRPLIFNRCILQAFKYGFEDQVLMERIDRLVKLVQPMGN